MTGGMIKQYRWIFWCKKCHTQCDFHSTTEHDRTIFARDAGFKYDKKLRGWICRRCVNARP